jgi:hypothetical protein
VFLERVLFEKGGGGSRKPSGVFFFLCALMRDCIAQCLMATGEEEIAQNSS